MAAQPYQASLAIGPRTGPPSTSTGIRPASHRLHNNFRPRRRSASGPSTNPARGNVQIIQVVWTPRGSRHRQCIAYCARGWLSSGECGRISWTLATLRGCLRDGPHSGLRRGLARGMTLETPGCQDGFKTTATALGIESIEEYPCNSDDWQHALRYGTLHGAIKRTCVMLFLVTSIAFTISC